MRTASVHLCRQWIGPAGAATVVFSVVGGVGLIAVQLLRAPALPSWPGLAAVVGASLPVIGEWVLPLGVLAGLTLLLARWRAEGEWTALQASGLSGRHLLPAAVAGGVVLALGTSVLTHQGAPWGRATLFDTLVRQVVPLPGRATTVGDLTVLPAAADDAGLIDLIVTGGDAEGQWVAHAATGQLSQDRTLVLQDGQWLGRAGSLGFGRLVLPLPSVVARPPPSAWSDQVLSASPDAYHQALHQKRTTWPLAGGLLLLLAVPAALVGRSWTVPLSVFGWWVAVRLSDGLAGMLGGWLSAWLPLFLLSAVTVLAWQRWGER